MLSVGVWIDLELHPQAGGHVKCWERFAQAAIALHPLLDLTLHFLGKQEETIPLAANVRYVLHPARFSTDRLPFLSDIASQTDLAPFNPKLLSYLAQHHLNHTTHQLFTFGQTALRFSQRQGRPLVSSIHTDVPKYTEIYTEDVIHKVSGSRKPGHWLNRLAIEQWKIPKKQRQRMEKKLLNYWPHCHHVMVSQPEEYQQVTQVLTPDRVSSIRRGIDKTLFNPQHRDRQFLWQTYGIPIETPVVLFVGRLNPCKNVMTLAHSLRQLLDQGIPVHGLFVGEGSRRAEITQLLGPAATLPGNLPQSQLACLYASADLFVFPSQNEAYGNVVVEAKASGLPVLISSQGGPAQWLQQEGIDGYTVAEDDSSLWSQTIAQMLADPLKLKQMGAAARKHIEGEWLSWQEILEQDLLQVWQAVASSCSRG